MKRLISLLMLAAMLMGLAAAEPTDARDAKWFYPRLYARGSRMHLLTDAQLDALAKMPSEDVHAIVEALFLAAAGVEEEAETALWKTYKTREEETARSAQNAAYRALTQPWLVEAFAPGVFDVVEEGLAYAARPTATPVPTPKPTPTVVTPTPAPTATPAPNAAPEAPAWTLADGRAALKDNEFGAAYLAMLAPYGGTDGESCMAVTQAVVQRWLAEIDHGKLAEINGHYLLWLYSADTPIDYPVVQCRNNDFYLDHMFNKKSNKAGTLFIDYRNLTGFRDPNTLVYGHHMRDGSMFKSLTFYANKGYFEAHPWLLSIGPEEIHLVEVFAGYLTTGSDHCYDIAISDEEDMRRFVATAEKKTNFLSHVEVDCKADHLVTLSTCAYQVENARYIVIGRLNLVWEKNPLFAAE